MAEPSPEQFVESREQRKCSLERLSVMVRDQEPLGELFIKALDETRAEDSPESWIRFAMIEAGVIEYLQRTDPHNRRYNPGQAPEFADSVAFELGRRIADKHAIAHPEHWEEESERLDRVPVNYARKLYSSLLNQRADDIGSYAPDDGTASAKIAGGRQRFPP